MTTAQDISQALKDQGTPERAETSAWFFKTGPGQYGEGDKFYGVRVPVVRAIVKPVSSMTFGELQKLLRSQWHEGRLAACLILVKFYRQGSVLERQGVYDFYLSNTQYINNWDLVDCSAEYIVGRHLVETDLLVLDELARSDWLWDRRIAMLACFYFTKNGDPEPALHIATLLAHDSHDLIQKAVGWMLREVGKRVDQAVEEAWLLEGDRYKTLPRTTLRYAIERFRPDRRQAYLKGEL